MNKNLYKYILLASLFMMNNAEVSTANASINTTSYNSSYSAGEKAFAVSDYVLAAENFAQALEYKPDDLRSRLKYAQSLYSLNKFKESSEHLQRVLQNSPNNIIARIFLAENYMQLGQKEEAKTQLEWVLKIQPSHQKAKSLYEKLEPNSISSNLEQKQEQEKSEEKINLAKNEDKIESEEKEENTKQDLEIKDDLDTENTIAKVENSTEKESISNSLSNNESMTFTPYIAGDNKLVKKEEPSKPIMPAAREDIQKIDIESFFKQGKNSYLVNLEKARYEIEKGNLVAAEKTIEAAEQLAKNGKNYRNILETQIFKSMIYIYQREYNKFGKHLITLKPGLSKETYQSFLDIYSRADEAKNENDQRRLSAGVAIGAGHYAIAVSLLKPVFDSNPDDPIVYAMLSEAQFHNFDYDGAENTLKKFAENHLDNAEAQFNLARFYLTANYNPELSKLYAEKALKIDPKDSKNEIIIALTDYAEGDVEKGIEKIKTLMPTLEDSSMKAICQRLISDGEKAHKESKSRNFISVLALPGSKNSNPAVFRFVGEDDLKAGSYFSAIEKFKKADENVEIGRAYLGLASALTYANEIDMASIAAGYGLKHLKLDMSKGKNIARASLYKALYDSERGDKDSAIAAIDLGLNCKDLDVSTYNKLTTLYDNLSNSKIN